jgi:AMMECR1 domain-containing protein
MERVSGPEEIVIGRDGVLLQKGGRSAVFLPQVAPEQGWLKEEMLSHLSMKAGLPADAWKSGTTFSTFQAIVFSENDVS